MPHPEYVDSFGDRGFCCVVGGYQQIRDALAAGAHRDRQHTPHRPKSAIQRQFANQHVLVGGGHRPHRSQDSERHGQIEAGAFLANIGRSKIDGYRLVRIPEAGIQQRRLDPFAALAHRGVRHADRDEVARAPTGIHVHFDVNQVRFDAEHSRTASPKKGH